MSNNTTRKYFGTDGIRGRVNTHPMTADVALKVAMASAVVLSGRRNGHQTNRVIIGKDTRLSGYMFEEAMGAGFLSMGMDVILVGPIPTPGIAMLTRSLRADLGVMISASHNPFHDNGIKLFGADGYKLDDAIEKKIEEKIESDLSAERAEPGTLGKAKRLDDALGRYAESLKSSFPKRQTLSGLKVVVDCAHGAAYKIAPQVLWELEADVVPIGVQPNGRNINDKFGATAPEALQQAVKEHGADIGIALDGDADRLILVDETGEVIDGDQVMGSLAMRMKENGTLAKDTLVATVMSNLGLERELERAGITLLRTKVGDRYVMESMREHGYNIGGEQSGHIILSDYSTTGDGLLSALQALAFLKEKGAKASEVFRCFSPVPQLLKNVRYQGHNPINDIQVQDAIQKADESLGQNGRILVRASGTEPLIRVMAEGDDQKQIEETVAHLCTVIEKQSKAA